MLNIYPSKKNNLDPHVEQPTWSGNIPWMWCPNIGHTSRIDWSRRTVACKRQATQWITAKLLRVSNRFQNSDLFRNSVGYSV